MSDVGVGSVLVVPFGRRRILGVVVELAATSEIPPQRLAEPIEALEAGASPDLVGLGLWVAHAYCSTPARGLELVLPPGTGSAAGQVRARREATAAANAGGRAALAGGETLGPRQREALELLVGAGRELGAAELAAAGVRSDTVRRLAARGLIDRGEREVRRRPRSVEVGAAAGRVTLDSHQRSAVERVVDALDCDGGELLLHGVTGSGKTEVYLAAAEATLDRGRGAIVLVPEIALTPQITARFRSRFSERVAILHSRLGAGERRDEWDRLRRGEARICVGPRSAVFAPIRGLGLIVVDEEHDPSYKQEGDPRYDAREVARRRAADSSAAILCGSATPRPESWLSLERLELPDRVDGRAMPAVEVLDMRRVQSPLHQRTREAFAQLRAERGKAIVLLNRRGWAPHLACRSCGHAWGCPHCDVSLVLHRTAESLRCHHCGHAEPLPDACPDCGSVAVARAGAGTERLEALLADELDPLSVFRLDSDSASRTGAHADILERFQAADSGVLVGTQMVAKGHDFPDVVLAVVLDADASLRFPDFRAEERTFAMVAQLAGRSGRGEGAGRVLVQTLAPEAAAIRHAADHDTAGFLAGELERRRELAYPPFSALVAIDLAAADARRLDASAKRLREAVTGSLGPHAQALGPAPRFRLRGRHRRRILVKAGEREPAVAAVRAAVETAAAARELREIAISVDVDPQ
jgi:primosomal protein N' (replication factor Y)